MLHLPDMSGGLVGAMIEFRGGTTIGSNSVTINQDDVTIDRYDGTISACDIASSRGSSTIALEYYHNCQKLVHLEEIVCVNQHFFCHSFDIQLICGGDIH